LISKLHEQSPISHDAKEGYIVKHANTLLRASGRNQKDLINPNIEQGISNDEVKPSLSFPSVFDIRYSIFCGSLLNFYAACVEVTD
jgi:hypothetical protein